MDARARARLPVRAAGVVLLAGTVAACGLEHELGFLALVDPAVQKRETVPDAGPVEQPPDRPAAAAHPPAATVSLGPRWPLERTGAEIRQVLGEPHFVRSDASAHLWRYRAGTCILNMFLFPAANGIRVTHAMYLQPSLEPLRDRAARSRCLSDLVRRGPAGSRTPVDQSTAGALSVN